MGGNDGDHDDEKHIDDSTFSKTAVKSSKMDDKDDSSGYNFDRSTDSDTERAPGAHVIAEKSSIDMSVDEDIKNAVQSEKDESVDSVQLTSPRVDAEFDAEPITLVGSVRSLGGRLHRSAVRLPVTLLDATSGGDRIRSNRMSRMSWCAEAAATFTCPRARPSQPPSNRRFRLLRTPVHRPTLDLAFHRLR